MKRRKADDHVLGARDLTQFDFCIIGSGAGGSTAAHILTAAGKTVLILEAGPNAYPGLDRGSSRPCRYTRTTSSSTPCVASSPSRAISSRAPSGARQRYGRRAGRREHAPKAVGGAFQHADCKTPRFNPVDFRLKSTWRP